MQLYNVRILEPNNTLTINIIRDFWNEIDVCETLSESALTKLCCTYTESKLQTPSRYSGMQAVKLSQNRHAWKTYC